VFYLQPVASNDDSGSDTRSRVTFLAYAGTGYAIAVDGYNGASGNIVLNLRQPNPAPPSNDNFASRQPIAGSLIDVPGINVGATKEPGEPNHAGEPGGRSVWWTWTAPLNGTVYVSAEASSFSPVVAVYTGHSVTNLSPVEASYDSLQFSTFAGATYQIAVDSVYGDVEPFTLHLELHADAPSAPDFLGGVESQNLYVGDPLFLQAFFGGTFPMRFQWLKNNLPIPGATNSVFSIAHVQTNNAGTYSLRATNALGGIASGDAVVTVGERPVNDNFANRIVLSGTDLSVPGTLLGASFEPGEPRPFEEEEEGQTVWYRWTAPMAGDVTISITGTLFNTILTAYTGDSVSNLAVLIESIGFASQFSFSTVAGATYQISVARYFAEGNFTLNLHQVAATLSPPEILDGPYSVSVFPSQPVEFEVSVSGSFPLHYQWFRDGQLLPGATGQRLSIVSAQLGDAGTYSVRVTNAAGQAMSTSAALLLIVPPGNDFFANRSNIVGQSASVAANTIRASRELGEPVHAGIFGARSVWWTWTAPVDGEVTIDTAGSDFSTTLAVYLGNAVSNLTVVAVNDFGSGGVTFSTTAGTTYQIAVDSRFVSGGNVLLNLQQSPAPLVAPEILDGPFSMSAYLADRVDFNVFVTGTFPMKFQWLKNGTAIPGATNSNFIIFSVVPGSAGAYSLRVTNIAGSITSEVAVLDVILPPPNDLFSHRIVIPGQSNTVSANTTLASREEDEPEHAGYFGQNSVWWRWTAPVNGTVTFTATGIDFSPLLAVYTGNSVEALAPVGFDWASGGLGESIVSFSTAAGETYQLAVDSWEGEFGNVSLSVNQLAGPLQAPAVFDGPYDQAAQLGYYSYIYMSASVSGSWPLRLQWLKDGQPVPGETRPNLDLYLTQTNQFGTYSLQASNPVGVATGSAVLSQLLPPPNDDFADRIVIPGQSNTVTANTVLATREQGEPFHNSYFGYVSAWWTWTAPIDGPVTFSTSDSDFTTLLAIYTGGSVSNLTYVASGFGNTFFSSSAGATYQIAVDGYFNGGNARLTVFQVPAPLQRPQIFNGPFSQTVYVGNSVSFAPSVTGSFPVTFQWFRNGQAIAGATNPAYSIPFVQTNHAGTYLLQASNAAGVTNAQALLTVPIPPPNDFFSNRIALVGGTNTVFGTNGLATREPGEPNHLGLLAQTSLWWTWTAPKSGQVQIDTIGSNFDTLLAIYNGLAFPLVLVINDDQSGGSGTSRVIFNAVGGTVYQIAVDGYGGLSGRIVLNLRQP
jgi:hypothetical protein